MPLAVLVLPLLTNPVMNAFSNYSKIMAEPHFGCGRGGAAHTQNANSSLNLG